MKAMKRTHLFAVLIGMIAMGIFAADASAMYHPGMGRFMQRDPTGSNQYADGMNLYQYVRNNPANRLDPEGLKSIELKSITMKRKHIKWGAVLGGKGGGYGHWWAELDGTESYGWWPKYPVPGLGSTIWGVEGELNGQETFGGSSTRDPKHGKAAEETFHPWRIEDNHWVFDYELEYGPKKGTSCSCVTEDDIKKCIRAFVADFVAKNKSWRYPLSPNCHSFQEDMMDECCMTKTKDD